MGRNAVYEDLQHGRYWKLSGICVNVSLQGLRQVLLHALLDSDY